ncbi:MAG TPA: cytochrome c3 family protein [Armatimonadota bacterium]|jgi:c(7)-type cytochrome triheme protein
MRWETRNVIFGLVILIALLPLLFVRSSKAFGVNAPKQPVDFFHRVHAGDKQIACQYCHAQTTQSSFAGMPATQLCIRCHRVIIPNHPEIKKLKAFWEKGEGVPWERVNRLPGFVYFTHKAHISAGVPCETCHGDMRKMDRARQATPMNMGWCVTCHRTNKYKKAPTDCVVCHR